MRPLQRAGAHCRIPGAGARARQFGRRRKKPGSSGMQQSIRRSSTREHALRGGSPMCYVLLRAMLAIRARHLLVAFFLLALMPAARADAARLTLTWTVNSTNEQVFSIERRDEVGSYAAVAALGAGESSYLDVTLDAGKAYCYRVRAFNAAGASPYTNEACGLSVQTGQDAIDLFVQGLFPEMLGRAPGRQGLEFWASFLVGNCNVG